MAKGRKLTDKEKKKIIADYIINQNYSETARLNKVSDTSVRRILKMNHEITNMVEQKKEQNTQDILNYLDSQLNGYKGYANYMFDRLNPQKSRVALDNLTEMQLVTIFGVLTDKMLKSKEAAFKSTETGYKTAQTKYIEAKTTLISKADDDSVKELIEGITKALSLAKTPIRQRDLNSLESESYD